MRKAITIITLAVLAGTALWATGLDAQREAAGLMALREPTKTVDFELRNIAGDRVSLSSFEGRVVVLNFWASWCGPCRSEIPSMQALYEELEPKGFEIVAINLQEPLSTVAPFVEEYGMSFTVLLDSSGEIGGTYGASSIPTTYIIDRKGFAVSGVIGSIRWDTPQMRAYLSTLLEQ